MEYGYYLLTALSIVVIGRYTPAVLQYFRERKAEKDFDDACERHKRATKNLLKILKDEDKNIKF